MGLRLIFERFVSPGENFMSAKDLRRFFKYEQNVSLPSPQQCPSAYFENLIFVAFKLMPPLTLSLFHSKSNRWMSVEM